MRRSTTLETIRQILEVRQLQEAAARIEAARADKALRLAREREAEHDERLRQEEEDWAKVISGPSPSLVVAGAWSAQVAKSQAALGKAQREVEGAAEVKEVCAQGWRKALANAEATDCMAGREAAHARRALEEARLSELADQISRRGGAA